ncbi:MAG: GNAT family N-acetyltransferase [Rhizobiales bacterium]|nr:GNAT family N-acetyltransferase [Hyphomicrobiales bacterium]
MRLTPISPRSLARRLRPIRALGFAKLRHDKDLAWRKGRFRLRSLPMKVYGAIGSLEVRLARTRADIRRAQRLRYEVFYEEMSAVPSPRAMRRRRDEDAYDRICDHLLVVDHANLVRSRANPWHRRAAVVGTYRILRQDVAEAHGGFYTQGEYDIAPLIAARPQAKFMELGRSCVLKPYRNRRTVELLWHGLWTYVREHGVDVMVGCASFPGTDPSAHAMALSYLHHHHIAPPEWRARAHPHLYTEMNLLPADQIDAKAALKGMPPLIKGYLRLGAYIGNGAVIDHQFATTDVLIVLPVSAIDPRYFAHFGAPDEQKARIARDPKCVM